MEMNEIPQNKEEKKTYDEGLDIASEDFNPLRALYTGPEYRVSTKEPKVVYQNLAALESALKKFGMWNLNKPQHKLIGTNNSNASSSNQLSNTKSSNQQLDEDSNARRFEPHQLAVTSSIKKRHQRNLYSHMASAEGPLAYLYRCIQRTETGLRNAPVVNVLLRNKNSIRGSVEGELLAFDKQWNLLLNNVTETWRKRKFKYGEQKLCGTPQDCSEHLNRLGITLPEVQVKSLNRKNVSLSRHIPQLLIRGEQVVLITFKYSK